MCCKYKPTLKYTRYTKQFLNMLINIVTIIYYIVIQCNDLNTQQFTILNGLILKQFILSDSIILD